MTSPLTPAAPWGDRRAHGAAAEPGPDGRRTGFPALDLPRGQAPAWVSGSKERITDDVEADITAAEAVVVRGLLRTDNAKKVAGIEAHLALRCGP